MKKRVAYAELRGWVVVVFGSRPPGAQEWSAYLDFLREVARGKQRGILFSEGGSLEPYQRRQAEAILGPRAERDRRIAVVSSSTFTWGFVKALSVFDPSYQPFRPRDMDRALAYIEVPPSSWVEMKTLSDELRAQVH